MVDLQNWELYAGSASPLVGATVELYAASLVHPNPGAILAVTQTDPGGRWVFTGLGAGFYDIRVSSPGAGHIKWYKGLAKISLETPIAPGQITSTEIADGSIVNADVKSDAAIAVTKLAHVGAGNVLKSTGTANVGGPVVNADVDANAGITVGKLAAGGTANRLVGTANGTVMAMQQLGYGMIPGGGTANRVLATADGSSVGMLQVAAAMNAPGAVMTLIRRTALTGPSGGLSYVGLPQTFHTLYIVAVLRGDQAISQIGALLQINGTGGDLYAQQSLTVFGTTVTASNVVRQSSISAGAVPAASAFTQTYGMIEIVIPEYAVGMNSRLIRCRNGYRNGNAFYPIASEMAMIENIGFALDNAAVTSIALFPSGGNFAAGSAVSIYGLPSALVSL